MRVVTHSGPFHADDVFACALLRRFAGQPIEVVRSRDRSVIEGADIAVDVGEVYAPAQGRFDHHQRDYTGELSSAGMVLEWLESSGRMPAALAVQLRAGWVEYIDAVDNGRREPQRDVPCLASVIGALGEQAESLEDFDARFEEAVAVCAAVLAGLEAGARKSAEAVSAVRAAMAEATRTGSRIMVLDRHYKWKRAYFELGGATHPTDYLLFPDRDSWRLLAIPPERDSMAQKRPLPAAWGGLSDEALSAVVGVAGARFCHKNRFIAVFETREAAVEAIERWGLDAH